MQEFLLKFYGSLIFYLNSTDVMEVYLKLTNILATLRGETVLDNLLESLVQHKRFIYDDDEEMDTEIDSPLSHPSKPGVSSSSGSSTTLSSLSNYLSFYYIKSFMFFLHILQRSSPNTFQNLSVLFQVLFYSLQNKKVILRHSSITLLVELYYIYKSQVVSLIETHLSLKNKKLLQIYIEKKRKS